MEAKAKLTVLFDPPFWVGIFEREQEGQYAACKVTFGAEPRDFDVYQLVLDRYSWLEFSPALEKALDTEPALNPKRLQRQVRQQTRQTGIGTKAQQALQLQREQGKAAKKVRSREAREAEQLRLYQLRQAKKKAKHRGR